MIANAPISSTTTDFINSGFYDFQLCPVKPPTYIMVEKKMIIQMLLSLLQPMARFTFIFNSTSTFKSKDSLSSTQNNDEIKKKDKDN